MSEERARRRELIALGALLAAVTLAILLQLPAERRPLNEDLERAVRESREEDARPSRWILWPSVAGVTLACLFVLKVALGWRDGEPRT